MYQHGHVDVLVLKDILGHENLGTTEIYTHIVDEQLRKASEANPLAEVKASKANKNPSKRKSEFSAKILYLLSILLKSVFRIQAKPHI